MSGASNLIILLRKVGRVPIDKLERAEAVCRLVGEREPDNGRSDVGRGQQLVIHTGETGATDLEIGISEPDDGSDCWWNGAHYGNGSIDGERIGVPGETRRERRQRD